MTKLLFLSREWICRLMHRAHHRTATLHGRVLRSYCERCDREWD